MNKRKNPFLQRQLDNNDAIGHVIPNIFVIKLTAENMPALQKEKMKNMKIRERETSEGE
jgi:hypothetical protein